jgi:hypothetical protein
MRRTRLIGALLALIGTTLITGCEPVSGNGGGQSGTPTCKIARPSPPFVVDGPRGDGSGFYQFTVRAEGEVICNGFVAQISITVVLHHKTNGRSGAVTGPGDLCYDKRECEAGAEYRRQRLYCDDVTRYEDYAQVTAWYKVTDSGEQKSLLSREGGKSGGSAYRPAQAGCEQD